MSLKHILLGMLRTPSSGYAIKADFDNGGRHYWAAELSQIYPTLKRMEADGLVRSKQVKSDRGPNQRIYQRTAAGRRELITWLEAGPARTSTRIAYLAQIEHLHEVNDLSVTREFISDLRAGFVDIARILREGEKGAEQLLGSLDDAGFHEYLVLGLGARTLQARLDWCDDAIDAIERRIAAKDQR